MVRDVSLFVVVYYRDQQSRPWSAQELGEDGRNEMHNMRLADSICLDCVTKRWLEYEFGVSLRNYNAKSLHVPHENSCDDLKLTRDTDQKFQLIIFNLIRCS